MLAVWDNLCCLPLFGPGRAQAKPGEEPRLALSPDQRQLIGVRTAEAAREPLRRTIRTVGRVEPDERRLATVNLKLEGWVRTLHADYEGKAVRKGDPVAEIFSPELFTLEQDYAYLLSSNEYANRLMVEYSVGDRYTPVGRATAYITPALLDKSKERLRFWGLTDEEIGELEKTGKPKGTLTVPSPIGGYVVDKPVVQGSRVAPGEKIVDIADLSTVWVVADLFASELPYVKAGQTARISVSHFPDREFPAKVDYVYPSVSGRTRTARVRFVVPNPGTVLKPKMFADVEIAVDLGTRLAVPEEAVIDTGARQVVYVDRGEGVFEPRRIRTGVRADGRVEVLSGVSAGEKVASSGAFLLDSEAKLKGISD